MTEPHTLRVGRDLDKARRDLQDATRHLGHIYDAHLNHRPDELQRAIEATIRAVSSVTLAVERLAALPTCDGGHNA